MHDILRISILQISLFQVGSLTKDKEFTITIPLLNLKLLLATKKNHIKSMLDLESRYI